MARISPFTIASGPRHAAGNDPPAAREMRHLTHAKSHAAAHGTRSPQGARYSAHRSSRPEGEDNECGLEQPQGWSPARGPRSPTSILTNENTPGGQRIKFAVEYRAGKLTTQCHRSSAVGVLPRRTSKD